MTKYCSNLLFLFLLLIGCVAPTNSDRQQSSDKQKANQTDSSANVTYSWSTGAWSACSKSCGGGLQTRSVRCLSSVSANVLNSYCNQPTKPALSQSCNTHQCSTCSGSAPVKSCTISNGNGVEVMVCIDGQWSGSGTCGNIKCNSGYENVNNKCVELICSGTALEQKCAIDHGEGKQVKDCINGQWGESYGACIPYKCDSGYKVIGPICSNVVKATVRNSDDYTGTSCDYSNVFDEFSILSNLADFDETVEDGTAWCVRKCRERNPSMKTNLRCVTFNDYRRISKSLVCNCGQSIVVKSPRWGATSAISNSYLEINTDPPSENVVVISKKHVMVDYKSYEEFKSIYCNGSAFNVWPTNALKSNETVTAWCLQGCYDEYPQLIGNVSCVSHHFLGSSPPLCSCYNSSNFSLKFGVGTTTIMSKSTKLRFSQ